MSMLPRQGPRGATGVLAALRAPGPSRCVLARRLDTPSYDEPGSARARVPQARRGSVHQPDRFLPRSPATAAVLSPHALDSATNWRRACRLSAQLRRTDELKLRRVSAPATRFRVRSAGGPPFRVRGAPAHCLRPACGRAPLEGRTRPAGLRNSDKLSGRFARHGACAGGREARPHAGRRRSLACSASQTSPCPAQHSRRSRPAHARGTDAVRSAPLAGAPWRAARGGVPTAGRHFRLHRRLRGGVGPPCR